MKIIFSPSKSQVTQMLPNTLGTEPLFLKKANSIRAILASLSRKKVKKLFNTSEKKTNTITSLYSNIQNGHALATFTGTSFSEFTPSKYSSEELSFAQKHLAIMSAAYGVLRPLDDMLSYRLDMTDDLSSVSDFKGNMYEYWSTEMAEYFLEDESILNLASDEYSKMLPKSSRKNITNISFLVQKGDAFKNNSVFSKQQRGLMLDHIIKNQIADIQLLKEYSSKQFSYNKDLSSEKSFVYTKTT